MITSTVKSFVRKACNKIRYSIRFFNQSVYVHPSAHVAPHAVLRANGGGSIKIGAHCEIHDFAMILAYGGSVVMGDNCSLNPFSIAYGHGGLVIGSGVRIAANTTIIPANHITGDDGQPLYLKGVTANGIVIADHVWIGAGVCILDRVEIGPHAIIGAGSVVTKNVGAGITVVGVPARPIKTP